MEIREEGFIAQLKGNLTKRRYKYATVFVDQYSDLSYVYLQKAQANYLLKHTPYLWELKYNSIMQILGALQTIYFLRVYKQIIKLYHFAVLELIVRMV